MPQTCECDLIFEKSVFADVIKDHDTSSFYIIYVGPKSNNKCSYKRDKRRPYKNGGIGLRVWVMQSQAKECLESPALEEAMEDYLLEPSEGAWLC